MKITPTVLRKRTRQALGAVTFLDLSSLGIGAIEELENCPNLQILDLSSNNIEEIEGIDCCQHLWNVNFSHNQLSSLTELSNFYAFGSVDLSNNNLTWKELSRIRHVIILDLHLHGNPELEKDIYYRVHAIDCLPNVWMLDGAIITSAERLQVQQLFHHSALSSHPLRRKTQDRPCAAMSHKTNVNCIHGLRTASLVSRFSQNEVQSSDTDVRRLTFLSENMEDDITVMQSAQGNRSPLNNLLPSGSLRKIIEYRSADRERCNMLLLLLVASLEFQIPKNLLSETLKIAKLNPYADVDTLHLFLLERRYRIRLVSLLLSASKLDWDMKVAGSGGLYDRLYLCLYYIVSDLVRSDWRTRKRKSNASRNLPSAQFYKSRSYIPPNARPQTAPLMKTTSSKLSTKKIEYIRKEHRMLLASEIVLLLSVVPSFYKHMDTDPGVRTILQAAINNVEVASRIISISKDLRLQGGDVGQLYEEMTAHIIGQIEQTALSTRRTLIQHTLFSSLNNDFYSMNEAESEWKIILNTKNAYPKRPKSAILTSGEHLTSGKRRTMADILRNETPLHASLTVSQVQGNSKVSLGSNILLGPQNLARVIAMPEANIALVQMSTIPAANGSVVIQTNNADDHYCYVDVTKLELDRQLGCWKPQGTVGDRVTLQATSRDRKRTASLSQTPDALLSDKKYHAHDGRKTRSSSLKSTFHSTTPRSSASKHGFSPRSCKNAGARRGFIITSDDEESEGEEGDKIGDPLMKPKVDLPPRPLSAVFKEKMDLRLPSQFSDTWTESGSAVRNEETPSATPLPPREEDETEEKPDENVVNVPDLGMSSMVYFHDEEQVAGDVEKDEHPENLVLEQETEEMGDEQIPRTDENGISNLSHVDDLRNDVENKGLGLQEEENLTGEQDQQNIIPPLGITEQAMQNADETSKVNFNLHQDVVSSDENDPEFRELSDIPNKFMKNLKNQNSNLHRRAISARQPKQTKVLSGKSRPMSAVTAHKTTRKYRDDVDIERPDSASSFQFERTEAWRSSASSSTLHLNLDSNLTTPVTGLPSGPQNRQKISFQIASLRPTPPQRPSSPSVGSKQVEDDSVRVTTLVPRHMNDKGGIKLASKWLADGRDLYEEYKQSRVYKSPRLPGYLDGTLHHNQKKTGVVSSLPLTTSLILSSDGTPRMYSSKRTSPSLTHLRAYLPPGIGIPQATTKSRFSNITEVKQLYGRYPAVTVIKPQKK